VTREELKILLSQGPVLLDGAMGTMLMKRGLQPGRLPESMCLEHPQAVTDIHKAYLEAGSRVVYTNTFGANAPRLARAGLTVEQVVSAAVACARRAAEPCGGLVALDLGPTGQMVEPMGSLTFEEACELYAAQVRAGVQAGADLAVIESMTDLYETKAALLAVKEHSSLPVLCSMSFESSLRTYTGCHVDCMVITLEDLGADAVGANCSAGPVQLQPVAAALLERAAGPVLVKPNAGLPVTRPDGTQGYDIGSGEFARCLARFAAQGAALVGGCCGTDPDYLREAALALRGAAALPRPARDNSGLICSASKLCRYGPGTPVTSVALTGSADDDLDAASEALYNGSEALVLDLGRQDDPRDEIKAIQATVNLPLVLAGGSPEALQKALRVCSGRPGRI